MNKKRAKKNSSNKEIIKLIALILAVLLAGFFMGRVLAAAKGGGGTTVKCTDYDRDGYFKTSGCGTAIDCNDRNPGINPGAAEICTDLIDQNCDGTTACPCTDSDGGNNPNVAGTVTGNAAQTYTDQCLSSSQIKEWYCQGTTVLYQDQSCQSGYSCSGSIGSCKPATTTSVATTTTTVSGNTCTDTDGGIMIYTKGTVYDPAQGKSFNDVCQNSGSTQIVFEYSCQNNAMTAGYYTCPAGYVCAQGACAQQGTVTTIANCVDSDGGRDYTTYGYVESPTHQDKIYDICNSNNQYMITEVYCSSSTQYAAEQVYCPNGGTCSNGACSTSGSGVCTDTDGGINEFVPGTVSYPIPGPGNFDYCTDIATPGSTYLVEYYCDTPNNPPKYTRIYCSGGNNGCLDSNGQPGGGMSSPSYCGVPGTTSTSSTTTILNGTG